MNYVSIEGNSPWPSLRKITTRNITKRNEESYTHKPVFWKSKQNFNVRKLPHNFNMNVDLISNLWYMRIRFVSHDSIVGITLYMYMCVYVDIMIQVYLNTNEAPSTNF